jgi:hypothetical protein
MNSYTNKQLYGLIWHTPYGDYEILSVYRDEGDANKHSKILNEAIEKAGVDDEAFKVRPVVSDTEGWVVESP